MDYWIWPILLLALGLGLAFLEVFFPTAGILAFFAAAAFLGAILLGFHYGSSLGLTITAAVVIGIPLLISLAFRLWPRTSVGKAVLLDAPKAEDVLPDDHLRRQLKGLIGRLGRAKCRMLPSGVVAVDGQTLDAMSEGMVIEAGQTVRVIKVESSAWWSARWTRISPHPTRKTRLNAPSTRLRMTRLASRWCRSCGGLVDHEAQAGCRASHDQALRRQRPGWGGRQGRQAAGRLRNAHRVDHRHRGPGGSGRARARRVSIKSATLGGPNVLCLSVNKSGPDKLVLEAAAEPGVAKVLSVSATYQVHRELTEYLADIRRLRTRDGAAHDHRDAR